MKKSNETYNGQYGSVDEIKAASRAAGNTFFEKPEQDFFASRVNEAIYHGKYFITSEKVSKSSRLRRFTARVAAPDGDILTLGKYCGHEKSAAAKKYINLHHEACISLTHRQTFWLYVKDEGASVKSVQAKIVEHPRSDGWEMVTFEIGGKNYTKWPIEVMAFIHGEDILSPL